MSWCTAPSPFRTKHPSPHLLDVLPADISHISILFGNCPTTRVHHTQCYTPSLKEAPHLLTSPCGWHLMGQPSCLNEDNSEASFRAPYVICQSLCCKRITIELSLIPNFAFHTAHRFFSPENTH